MFPDMEYGSPEQDDIVVVNPKTEIKNVRTSVHLLYVFYGEYIDRFIM